MVTDLFVRLGEPSVHDFLMALKLILSVHAFRVQSDS